MGRRARRGLPAYVLGDFMCVQVSDWRRGAGHMRPSVLPTTTTTSSSSSACQTSLRECGTRVPSATRYELLSNNDSDSVLVQTELLQRKTRSLSQPTTNWCPQTNYLPSLSLPPPSPPLSLSVCLLSCHKLLWECPGQDAPTRLLSHR